jgi:hypothetical protein
MKSRIKIVEPVCFQCKWLIAFPYCVAYPNGIPDAIRLGRDSHAAPTSEGYRFEELEILKEERKS